MTIFEAPFPAFLSACVSASSAALPVVTAVVVCAANWKCVSVSSAVVSSAGCDASAVITCAVSSASCPADVCSFRSPTFQTSSSTNTASSAANSRISRINPTFFGLPEAAFEPPALVTGGALFFHEFSPFCTGGFVCSRDAPHSSQNTLSASQMHPQLGHRFFASIKTSQILGACFGKETRSD